jgi:hypothetical protein
MPPIKFSSRTDAIDRSVGKTSGARFSPLRMRQNRIWIHQFLRGSRLSVSRDNVSERAIGNLATATRRLPYPDTPRYTGGFTRSGQRVTLMGSSLAFYIHPTDRKPL